MHWYRIIAQIFLFSLVLAFPIVVREKQEALGVEMAMAEDVATMPKNSHELGVASDKSTSPRLLASPPDALATPQHSSSPDGTTSLSHCVPHFSSVSSPVEGCSWPGRPPRLFLSPSLPAPLYGRASPPRFPNSNPQGPPLPPPWPWWLEYLEPVVVPESLDGSESSHSSGSESAEISLGQGLVPPSPQHSTGSDQPTTGTYSPTTETETEAENETNPPTTETDSSTSGTYSQSDKFTSSQRPSSSTIGYPGDSESVSTAYLSALGGSQSSHYISASGGSESVHSHISMPEGASPTEPSPDNAEFLKENMMKNLKIAAGVVVIGSVITASIVGSQIKHHPSHRLGDVYRPVSAKTF